MRLFGMRKSRISQISHHYFDLPYANFGLSIYFIRATFFVTFCPKICTNGINSSKFAQDKYLWDVAVFKFSQMKFE